MNLWKIIELISYFQLSWADIFFVAILDYNNGVLKEDIINAEKYPHLDNLRKKIRSMPAIATWIGKRPESEY